MNLKGYNLIEKLKSHYCHYLVVCFVLIIGIITVIISIINSESFFYFEKEMESTNILFNQIPVCCTEVKAIGKNKESLKRVYVKGQTQTFSTNFVTSDVYVVGEEYIANIFLLEKANSNLSYKKIEIVKESADFNMDAKKSEIVKNSIQKKKFNY